MDVMMKTARTLFAFFIFCGLAACASQAQQPDFTPPPKKPLDAKTQLETGRKY
jgi:hypothetical protein